MKMICFLCIIFSFSTLILAQEVDILSDFNVTELPAKLIPVKEAYTVNIPSTFDYFTAKNPQRKELAKFLVFNPFFQKEAIEMISKFPKEKLILFVWEPYILSPQFYEPYSKVYTWDDRLVDNVKFFRYHSPYLTPFSGNPVPFKNRKLCTTVAGYWPRHRLDFVRFFDANYPEKLECYGRSPPPNLKNRSMYVGPISGTHTGNEKISILKNYRFCMCFEHSVGLQGYITEKIFSCFAAGCVPIYWGAENVEKYIPKTCFIDYRDFKSDQELYDYISTISEKKHQKYVKAIKTFLMSEQAQIFAPESFDQLIYKAVSQ